jgi:hypothetical protein
VTDLLTEKLPMPLTERWLITAAQINLYYPPVPGKVRPKVVTVEVTRKGRLNLHKFDATFQAQLERYLVSLGILDRGQRLNVGEEPPAGAAESPAWCRFRRNDNAQPRRVGR